MEYFCILVSDENRETVREKVKDSQVLTHEIFNIPVSETGKAPATHWFCIMKYDDVLCQKLLDMKNLTEMEKTSSAKTFLSTRNLRLALR